MKPRKHKHEFMYDDSGGFSPCGICGAPFDPKPAAPPESKPTFATKKTPCQCEGNECMAGSLPAGIVCMDHYMTCGKCKVSVGCGCSYVDQFEQPKADKPTFAYSPDTYTARDLGKGYTEEEIAEARKWFSDTNAADREALYIDWKRLAKPAAPPEAKSTFAYELAMYLTRNNTRHTFTAPDLQAEIERFMRDKR